jgi:hypothetical protein
MDPDTDPGGPKTCGSGGSGSGFVSGSATLILAKNISVTSISGVGGREGQPEIPAAEKAECRATSGGAGSVLQEKVGLIQCCGSGIFIPDAGSRILIFTHPGSQIPEPKTAMKDRGEKKNLLSQRVRYLSFGAINFTKLNYFIFEMLKKIGANFQRIIELFTQKLSLSSKKYGFGI